MNADEKVFDPTTRNQTQPAAPCLEGLLGDPSIGDWARAAAKTHRMTPLEALDWLAQALVLDARRHSSSQQHYLKPMRGS